MNRVARAVPWVLAVAVCVPAAADPPRWQICLRMMPGVARGVPYYRACTPIPAACVATPTCACLARHVGPGFAYHCERHGHIFVRGTVGLP